MISIRFILCRAILLAAFCHLFLLAAGARAGQIGDSKSLKNLMTGETIDGQTPPPPRGGRRQNDGSESRIAFKVHLLPHSYCVFRLEK